MNKSLSSFCAGVEGVLGLAAVRADWQRRFADDWPWAQSLLRATNKLAGCYPKLDPRPESLSQYRVVWRDEEADRYLGSCPDGTGTIDLCRAELVIHELDCGKLAARIAAAMRMVVDFDDVDGVPHAQRVGVMNGLSESECWVYMALQAGPDQLTDTLLRLSARNDRSFMLLTPSKRSWRASGDWVRRGGSVLSFEDSFTVGADGQWQQVAPQAGRKPTTANGAGKRTQTVEERFRGLVLDQNHVVVLRVLFAAKVLLHQEEVAARTDEYGGAISTKTVGDVLKLFTRHGVIERPNGPRKGVCLSGAGRELADSVLGEAA